MQNMGAEGAMEWVLTHMEDANFNDPLSEPSQAPPHASTSGAAEAAPAAADPESVMMLVSMGFTDQQAAAALKVVPPTLCCLSCPSHCLTAWGVVSSSTVCTIHVPEGCIYNIQSQAAQLLGQDQCGAL